MIALVTGGSGSGKSAYAESLALAQPASAYIYLATMKRYDDAETRARIDRHRRMRADKGFITVEQEKDISSVDLPENACVLLECLPNLVANEMFDGGDPARIPTDLIRLAQHCASLIVVTDNIFSDGVTYDPSTEAYLQCLALCQQCLAGLGDTAMIEVVCGIPVTLKGGCP